MNKFGVIDKQSFWKIKQKLAPKSVSFPTSSDFEKKIIYLDKKIDKKVARFDSNIVKAGMNKFGVTDKQSFWKINRS